MTSRLIPVSVLLATGGLLAYVAREALQPRLAVHVASVIPKSGAASPGTGGLRPGATDSEEAPSEVSPGPVAVQAPGWIEPAPYAVSIPALAEGVVREVLVLEGDRVEPGQVVVRLIDDDARLAVRASEAAIAEREKDVERARAALATAESQVEVERSAAAEARDEVTRKRDLVAAGGISEGTFRRLEIRLRGLEARVMAAENAVGESRAALAQAEAARMAAQVLREEAELRLQRTEVRSPVAGVVLARLVEPGSRISMSGRSGDGGAGGSMSGAVVRVYDPARLQVRVDVPLADAAKVGIGTRATVSTEALAEQAFSGVVSRAVHEANIQRNTVQFKVTLDAPSPLLRPEMLVRVRLHGPAASSRHDLGAAAGGTDQRASSAGGMTLLVPAVAVMPSGEGRGQVWIVDTAGGSPVARRREVGIAPSSEEGFFAVTSGLRLTDRVVLDPPAPPAIKDGTRLDVRSEQTRPASQAVPTMR